MRLFGFRGPITAETALEGAIELGRARGVSELSPAKIRASIDLAPKKQRFG